MNLTTPKYQSLWVYKEKIAIYRIVRGFLGLVMRDANIDIDSLFKFARETDEVIFLFDPEVSIYIHELYKKAVELRYTATAIKHHTVIGEERSKHINRNGELLLWFSEQIEEVRAVFSKYIAL